MSPDDDHGYGAESRRDGYGGAGQTRTRLPDRKGDVYGGARRPGRSSPRSLVTVVGVVVLLIAAIAFANRSGGDSSSDGDRREPAAAPTAASGDHPVSTRRGGVATGFPHDEKGAQSAAANYAVALGSADMFDKNRRDTLLDTIIAPSRTAELKKRLDAAYTPAFTKAVGLNEDGSTPSGFTFVSRTTPIGSRTTASADGKTTVAVWCSGLLGLAGEDSTTPVTDSWFTLTLDLLWSDGDWKIDTFSQKAGPTPVPGDGRASTSDEIAEATKGFGGFSYAR